MFNYEQSIWGRGEAGVSWFDPAAFRLREALLALEKLSTGAKVLEVGCGAGRFIRAIKRLRLELQCFGCDISSAAIVEARSIGGGVEYALSESVRLPYADETFDALLVFDVLEHVVDPAGLLAEIRRVLKKGGIFYCFAPCEGDWTSLWRWLDKVGLKKDLTKKYAGHVNYFSRSQIIQLLRESGFHIARLRYSEHLLGQLLGVAVFYFIDRQARRMGRRFNNEEFFAIIKSGGRTFAFLRRAVNFLVFLESCLFSRVHSPNLHLRVGKKIFTI